MHRMAIGILLVLALAAVVGAVSTSASANPDYLAAFRGTYPTCTIPDELNIVSAACYTCHNSNAFFGDWNCYRRDLISRLRAGRSITEAIRDIETWDSDGDGTDNLTEILYPRPGGLVGYNPGLVGPQGTDPCLTLAFDDVPGSTLPVTGRLETPPPLTGACCIGGVCAVTTPNACAGASRRFAGPGTSCNPTGNATTPCCKADFNQSGVRGVEDIFSFLSVWFAGCAGPDDAGCQGLSADIDASGTRDVNDIFAFLSLWFAGC